MESSVAGSVDQKNPGGTVYRAKDFVYIDENPHEPFRVGQILGFKNGQNSPVQVKVRYLPRRRELDSHHLRQFQEVEERWLFTKEYERLNFTPETLPEERIRINHQFKLKGLVARKFVPRDGEECHVNASFIRGKCIVYRYVDVETTNSYIDKDDVFFFISAFEDQFKAIILEGEPPVNTRKDDCGKPVKLGMDIEDYRPMTPEEVMEYNKLERDSLIWNGYECHLTDMELEIFFSVVRSVGLYGRAIDQTKRVNDSSIQSNLAYAFRDSTKYLSYNLLHLADYDLKTAITKLFVDNSPVICTDQLELWLDEDIQYFYDELKKLKRFGDIGKSFKNNNWKSVKEMIEFYYMHKVTETYLNHKKERLGKKIGGITQIFIPNSTLPINHTCSASKQNIPENVSCVGCHTTSSSLWYPWDPARNYKGYYLCSFCWIYWKKYGGLLHPHPDDGMRPFEGSQTCNVCGLCFLKKRTFERHLSIHFLHQCTFPECAKKFSTSERLRSHTIYSHENVVHIPKCQNLQAKLFFFWSSSKWKQLRKAYSSYSLYTKVLCRRRFITYEKVMHNYEGRVPRPHSYRKFTKLADIFPTSKKRISPHIDDFCSHEPRHKVPATVSPLS